MSVSNNTSPVRYYRLATSDSADEAISIFNKWVTANVSAKDLALVKIYDKSNYWQFALTVHAVKHKVFLHVIVPKSVSYILEEASYNAKLKREIDALLSKEGKEDDLDHDEESDSISHDA